MGFSLLTDTVEKLTVEGKRKNSIRTKACNQNLSLRSCLDGIAATDSSHLPQDLCHSILAEQPTTALDLLVAFGGLQGNLVC